MSGPESLFDGEFLRRLERLVLAARRPLRGRYSGGRRSPRRGVAVEFADYRDYVPGDDERLVDWKAYARLDRLFVKLFSEEEDATVHIFVDASGSMDWGEGPAHKGTFAKRLAAAVAYLSLVRNERVGLGGLRGGDLAYLPPRAGRAQVWQVWRFLADLPLGGETDLERSLAAFGRYRPRPGLTLLISDLLAPGGYAEGLKRLQAAGQEVAVIQVLAPDELDPDLEGDLRLVDVESGAAEEVSVTPALLEGYRRRREAFTAEAAAFCRRRGMAFALVDTSRPLEEVILRRLTEAGVLARV